MGRLLFIGAHPDDETFLAAGTFAKCSTEGHEVSLVYATRGQKGKTGDQCTKEELPGVRERELHQAMSQVGVRDISVLDYQDRELAAAPIAEMRVHLVRAIRRIQPDVVMTFDPHGGNAHPDHTAISAFTSDAIASDGRWLPELGAPHKIRRLLWTPPTFIYRLPPERDIRQEPGFDFLIDVTPWVEQKAAAFRSHATQFPGLQRLFFDGRMARTFSLEAFRLAWGDRPQQVPAENLWAD